MREAMSGSGGGGERRCHIVRDVVSYFRTRPPDGIFLDTSIMSLVFFSSLSLSLSSTVTRSKAIRFFAFSVSVLVFLITLYTRLKNIR